MKKPEFTVYSYHIAFLKDFPELSSWLNCNGFTLLHSHNDFRTRLTHTFWDDHTSEAEKNGTNDAENSLMITYCQPCKSVTVYHREIIADAHNEKALVRELDQCIFGKRTDDAEACASLEGPAVEYPTPEEIKNWISDLEQQQP